MQGLGWDDERYRSPTSKILAQLIKALADKYGINLSIVSEEDLFKTMLKEKEWDFVVLDVLDKASGDSEFGFWLASHCRSGGFKNPIFMLSTDRELLVNSRKLVIPPYFLFHKDMNRANMAYQMHNFLEYHGLTQSKVFIGHGGRSVTWRELSEYVQTTHQIECEEFNSVPVAGMAVTERLLQMKNSAGLAILLMTAEDEQANHSIRARQNVIHEIGFFQAQLGYRRVVVMVEEGCETFSNYSLISIRFNKGNIKNAFGEIDNVLREQRFIS